MVNTAPELPHETALLVSSWLTRLAAEMAVRAGAVKLREDKSILMGAEVALARASNEVMAKAKVG